MKTKILIVEHYHADIKSIKYELKRGNVNYIAEMVQSKKEFEKALHNFKPDIILSNYTSPTFDGVAIFEIKEKLVPETPFIFISESIGEENAVKLIKNGATDFVLKERLGTLADKINRVLEGVPTIKLKTEHKQSGENQTQELWQNESDYRSLFENSMNGILLTITDGQILSANPAACEIFEMTEQEIIDAGRLGITDSTDPRLKLLIEERQRTGRSKGELTLVRKNGCKFPAELTSTVFKDAYGEERTSMIITDITERKETEQKLAQSTNDLLQALNDHNKILDFSLDLICSYDEEGRFVRVNAASEFILGYKPQELIGKKYMDFIFQNDAENSINADIDIRSGVQLTMFENRYIHKSGSIVPLLWSAVWDDEYKMSYCMAKDTTNKKKLEKAFEIEKQRFHDLYSQAPSCMGTLKGPNHVYELANNLYLQLIDKKDIIGKTVKEVLPELEAQGIFEFLDTVYKTGETFSANEMLVKFDFHGNGKLVDTYLNFIYQAHRDIDGTIDGIFFFANDVTEQVLSRKKIEESVLRYSSLIEQASDAICIINESMKIVEVNRYACEKLGYSKAEILQLSIGDFFLEEDLKTKPLKIDSLKGGKTFRGERRIKRKDGTLIDVELSTKILKEGSMILFARDITENKKAQLALMESEKKYRQIIETAQEGIWQIDENHKTTFVNDKMCQILEYTQKEMMGKGIYSFMDEEGKQIAAKLMKREKEIKFEKSHFKYIAKSGKEIWTNVAANPFISETGDYKGSMAMVTDITEIKKTQQTLKENEKKYQYLFDNNPMPMWVIDLITFKFLDVNKMAILQYGYSREEFLSMTALDIRPDKDKDHFTKSCDPSEINATNFNRGIWNHQKKNGTIIPVEIIAHEIIYEGSPARFILSNDITDRKKSEEALWNSEEKFRNLINFSPVGITLSSKQGEILEANQTIIDIMGFEYKEEFINITASELYVDKNNQKQLIELFKKDGVVKNFEAQLKRKNGELIWVSSHIHPFKLPDGEMVMLSTTFDITDRKKAELKLERQNKELAFQNQEKENRADELIIANKELVKINTELDRFVYSVSHDLRSPLTSILGLLSFIEGESQEPDTLEHAEMIHKSINRLDEFIKNILSYSRNNRTGLEIEKLSIQETALAIVNSLQSMKEAKEIHYEIDIREDHPFYTDRLRFNNILENLISNAIKHHKKDISGRYIKITGQSDSEKLHFSIADNGIGIAPAHHQKIFDMFFRLSSKKDGSGIGLYIVKDTIEILQGSIEIQSEKGTGTTFIITLKNLKP